MRGSKRATDAVELNLAAMLDMAFQLLAFFTITFRPAPVEVEIQMRLPRPERIELAAGPKTGENEFIDPPAIGRTTLVVTVVKRGEEEREVLEGDKKVVRRVHKAGYLIEAKSNKPGPFYNLEDLRRELQKILGDEGLGFEQVIVQAGPDLQYNKVMEVVETCSSIRLPNGKKLGKVSMVSMKDSPPAKK